ncbi:MAG: translation initiation factor Sui1 [Nitrospirae bacterium]|nr:translation initiation factor Sui1 [Nitrospirota bacterium]
MLKSNSDGIVYSTGQGRICSACGRPAANCECGRRQAPPNGDGIVRVGISTKGRKGKGVTVISGVPPGEGGLDELARRLKQKCGAGGTVKDGVIEIQGDFRDILVAELTKQGYKVKRAGG